MSSVRKLASRALSKAARIIDRVQPIIYLDDEFITQLCYINAGILEKGNIHSFDYVLSRLASAAPILEIGSYCGLSANVLAYLKRKHGISNPILTCDKWEFQKPSGANNHIGNSALSYNALEAFAKTSYMRNVQMFSGDDLPFTFEMTSDEFFDCWRDVQARKDIFGRAYTLGGPLSFCFIDGNHTYPYAKRDFLNCDDFLEVGGFILFDDSTLEKDEVRLVMPEVFASGRYKLIAQNPYHLFQKIRN
jgi:hypothetical protein